MHILEIEVLKDGTFGKIYPETHPGWDRLIGIFKDLRKKERKNAKAKSTIDK